MTELPITYEFTSTAAPVQAEGTVGSRRFYFHARHEKWTFSVAEHADVDPADIESADEPGRGWFRSGVVAGRSGASFLDREAAAAIIRECAAAYIGDHAR